METFIEPKDLVSNSSYAQQRQKSLATLSLDTIDAPIANVVSGFQDLPCCFTLQSCYGHFMYPGQQEPTNTEPLPIFDDATTITYRIAYIAFCIENSTEGKDLLESLRNISATDPKNIQFGSAEWFWTKQVNSYALQVEPKRYMDKDQVIIGYQEALRIQQTRDNFFSTLRNLLFKRKNSH